MRLSTWIAICLSLICTCLQAQRTQYGHVKGTVIDSATRLPLEAATISVFLVKDSTLINYALSNRKGEFIVSNLPLNKPSWLMISYNGYGSHEKNFTLSAENKELLLGFITLKKSVSELEGVTVVARRPPVMVREDTLEFNVSSFKTMPNAVLEDVIKQLPGFELDRDGNLLVNGKKVTKLTLDGKEFFGGDPKIALKNLPKDIIDKIQVADDKTREARFNKRTDGNEDLAINLTLRKEIKQGWMGRVNAGYGSGNRYESAVNVNSFRGTRQMNFIGNINNTSQGGSSGNITDSKAAGVNYSDNFGKDFRINSSYYFNRSMNRNSTQSRRQNILPDTTFFYNSINSSTNSNDNHRLSLNVDYNLDSMTELHLNSSFSANQSNSATGNIALSEGISGNKINSSSNLYSSQSDGNDMQVALFFGRRFKNPGRRFTIGLNYNYNDRPSTDYNIGENIFFIPDSADIIDSVNQLSNGSNLGRNISFAATYSEPLFKNVTLLLQYNYQKSNNTTGKATSRFNSASGKYDIFDSVFTNLFRNNTETNSPGISISYNKQKLRFSIGSGMQMLSQNNYNITANTQLQQRYVNITPSVNFGYSFSKTSNINLSYSGRNQQPSIDQLQPVPDNSNPLYVRLGNPDLSPSFYHNLNVNVRRTNGTFFWHGSLGFNTTSNQIIYETFYDDLGRQASRPVNVNGNYRVSGNYNFSKTWKRPDWSFRINFSGNSSFNRNKTFTNKVINISNGYTISQSVGINYTYKQLLSVLPSFRVNLNKTRYSVQSLKNAEFINKAFSLVVSCNYPKRLIIENNLQYTYNDRVAPGFRKGILMWGAAIDWQLLKRQQCNVRLTVYDLLKQNIGVSRTVTETYIEDRQSNILQQYFLLSVVYNLRSFGK